MRTRISRFCTAFLLLMTLSQFAVADGTYRTLNEGQEGQEVVLETHLVQGKLNIIDFHSEYCARTKGDMSYLEQLAASDPSIVVSKVDINRPDIRGIDWQSPVAQQYKVRSLPFFKIFDGEGQLIAEGQAARDKVDEMFKKNGIK